VTTLAFLEEKCAGWQVRGRNEANLLAYGWGHMVDSVAVRLEQTSPFRVGDDSGVLGKRAGAGRQAKKRTHFGPVTTSAFFGERVRGMAGPGRNEANLGAYGWVRGMGASLAGINEPILGRCRLGRFLGKTRRRWQGRHFVGGWLGHGSTRMHTDGLAAVRQE
jgi:hypothetical protein